MANNENGIPQYIPGAHPRFFRGNEIGCLVTHGFMAAPPEVAWLGEHLAQQGYTVYCPRLTGHGMNYRDMVRMRWQDWYAQLLDGYHILRQQCERVYVVGHSMGGCLSLLLSSQVAVDGAVIAAAPISIPHALMAYSNLISVLRPFTYHPSEPELNAIIEAEQERRGEPITSRVHYPHWSSAAIHQLYLLIKQVNGILPQVNIPLHLVYAQQDTTVVISDMALLREKVSSTQIHTSVIDEGQHLIFQDAGREQAIEAVGDWLAAQLGAKMPDA